jgi:hypothetical protein
MTIVRRQCIANMSYLRTAAPLIAIAASVMVFENHSNAQTFGCPADPKIGDTCTQRVSINLRKVESEGRDEFDRRFEPRPGWAIQDCDTRSAERVRTGEASGPNCTLVADGNNFLTTSFVQSQQAQVIETILKGKAEASIGIAKVLGEIENRARSEFNNLAQSASQNSSSNAGAQINAWVAVRGGCKTREPFTGQCLNWGPGGSLGTDVIIRLIYVGTNGDVSQVATRILQEAQMAKDTQGASYFFNSAGTGFFAKGGKFCGFVTGRHRDIFKSRNPGVDLSGFLNPFEFGEDNGPCSLPIGYFDNGTTVFFSDGNGFFCGFPTPSALEAHQRKRGDSRGFGRIDFDPQRVMKDTGICQV